MRRVEFGRRSLLLDDLRANKRGFARNEASTKGHERNEGRRSLPPSGPFSQKVPGNRQPSTTSWQVAVRPSIYWGLIAELSTEFLLSGVVALFFCGNIVLLFGRQWMESVQDEDVAVRIVESWEGRRPVRGCIGSRDPRQCRRRARSRSRTRKAGRYGCGRADPRGRSRRRGRGDG